MHPPYKHGVGYVYAEFPAALPAGSPWLEFDLGFRDGSTSRDGCRFRVSVEHEGKRAVVFDEVYAALGAWAPRQVDLSAYAGEEVAVRLEADVGANDDSYSDWACWGAPRITLGQDVLAVELYDEEPHLPILPAPAPLPGLTAAELGEAASAELRFETCGADAGAYESFVYFNGVALGPTPGSGTDTAWVPAAMPLDEEALATLAPMNDVVVRNPNRDYMKVRRFCVHFTLKDGRAGSSWIDAGPFTSARGWAYAEGEAVPVGADLPTARLKIAVER